MNKKEFDSFFKPYAKNVENASKLAFWKLSDALIFKIIKQNIPTNINASATIMDVGGGTGRWITKLSAEYKCKFIIYDLSEDMIKQAKQNIKEVKIEDRVLMIHGDICNMKKVSNASVDYIISIYNPISFIYENERAIKELYRILNPGGKVIIMGHGYYNAIASKINNYVVSADELIHLAETYHVKWNPYVPNLVTYSKESMETLLQQTGFTVVNTYGIPIFVQPGPEDFDPENKKKSRISKALEDPTFFDAVFKLEMKHNSNSLLSNRGMNVLTCAVKM